MKSDLERNFLLLSDGDRFVRKEALQSFKDHIKEWKNSGNDSYRSFSSQNLSILFSSMNDNIEVNRELAVEVVWLLLGLVNDVKLLLPHLFPVLLQRIGQKDSQETSEELRLSMLKLVQIVLNKEVDIGPFIDDILEILQWCLYDSYHEVKKLSCSVAESLSQRKHPRFYQKCECLINALLSNLLHQHSKVRQATVNALGVVILHGQGKLVDNVLPCFTQRLFDSATSVRRSVIDVAGNWLLELPDRYSYHTKLLPLILSGIVDESNEIQQLSHDLWHEIGLKFERENQEQIKDKLDFDKGVPCFYPLGCKRAPLGCRELVYRSASRILPALCRDLGDWQEVTRTKAASLLPIIVMHLESSTAQHTQHILTGLGTGLSDAIILLDSRSSSIIFIRLLPPIAFSGVPLSPCDLSINRYPSDFIVPRIPQILGAGHGEKAEAMNLLQQLLLAVQLTACFVDSCLWWPLLKSCLDRCTEGSAPTSLAGHLFLLSGFISGSPFPQLASSFVNVKHAVTMTDGSPAPNGLNSNQTILFTIVRYLTQKDISSAISCPTKSALLECVLVSIRRIEEMIVLVRKSTSGETISDTDLEAARLLLGDPELRSWLFYCTMALSAVWTDSNQTDFSVGLLNLTEEAVRRLAACERDCRSQNVSSSALPNVTNRISTHAGPVDLLCRATNEDLDQFYSMNAAWLLKQLDIDLTESGTWHSRSIGLSILTRLLQTAGPSLLVCPTTNLNSNQRTCLDWALDLLERGCRLNYALCDASSDKSSGSIDPLTMSSEADLRLRGLTLLIRLTDSRSIRKTLSSSSRLAHCLDHLVLPACIWRVGRTAEVVRQTAVTCLVTLLAAASDTDNVDEHKVDRRTMNEVRLDQWLCEHIDSIRQLLGDKTREVNERILKDSSTTNEQLSQRNNLTVLSSSQLSVLLSRIGGLLDDSLESTRRMACLSLTLLLNGLFPRVMQNASDGSSSPLPPEGDNRAELVRADCCLKRNSFADEVLRFYPNLLKRLNDVKNPIRMLVTETLNAWLRFTHDLLTFDGVKDTRSTTHDRLLINPVHSAIIQDFVDGLLPHLDDSEGQIRAAVARVIARVGLIAPDVVRQTLTAAREHHRYSELCDQLLSQINDMM